MFWIHRSPGSFYDSTIPQNAVLFFASVSGSCAIVALFEAIMFRESAGFIVGRKNARRKFAGASVNLFTVACAFLLLVRGIKNENYSALWPFQIYQVGYKVIDLSQAHKLRSQHRRRRRGYCDDGGPSQLCQVLHWACVGERRFGLYDLNLCSKTTRQHRFRSLSAHHILRNQWNPHRAKVPESPTRQCKLHSSALK